MNYSVEKAFFNYKIQVVKVPADENCTFYTIVQQLTSWSMFTIEFKEMANTLRKQVKDYLWDHRVELKDIIMATMQDDIKEIPEENSEE